MKRCLLAMLFMVLLVGTAWAGEGQKVIKTDDGKYQFRVPEKAPDFLGNDWVESYLTMGIYPNGITSWAVMLDEKQGMVVRSLIIGNKDKTDENGQMLPIMICFCVAYDGNDCTDWYFDEGILSNKETSGVFVGPMSNEDGKKKLEEFNSRFLKKEMRLGCESTRG